MRGGSSWLRRADGGLRSGWWALIWALAHQILPFLTLALLLLLLPLDRLGAAGWEAVALLNALGATAFCLGLRAEGPGSLGLALDRRFLRDLTLGLLAGVLLLGLAALALAAGGGVRWERAPAVGMAPLVRGFAFYLLVALVEELVYRGFAFQRLLEVAGPWPGLLLGGAWFAWAHAGNPGMDDPIQRAWALATIALAGLFLGLAWLRTRSLALPIGLHLGWNWMQGSVLGFAVSGTTDYLGPWRAVVDPARPAWYHGGTFGLEASVFGALAALAAVLGLGAWKGASGGPSTDGAR